MNDEWKPLVRNRSGDQHGEVDGLRLRIIGQRTVRIKGAALRLYIAIYGKISTHKVLLYRIAFRLRVPVRQVGHS
jgi:hypothetical protein